MGTKIRIPGLNIQDPWSEMILSGSKTIETRSYPIPKHFLNTQIAVIETHKDNSKKATIKGVVIFSNCYKYNNFDHWLQESHLHKVSVNDPNYKYNENKAKWAWVISNHFRVPSQPPPIVRGIKYAKECEIVI